METTFDVKDNATIHSELKNFILTQKHPCVMARTVFKLETYQLEIYDSMTSDSAVPKILDNINEFLEHYDFESNEFKSLIVCFKNDDYAGEEQFEDALWNLLQKIHNQDSEPWDFRVSNDSSDPNFSFSVGGRAFFIVGMHPKSSRFARQSPYPTIVFNLHWQFEKLRQMGAYKTIQKRIRRRDKKLQGTVNPMLKDFGTDTEAKQYSGRKVEANWKCPFHINSKTHE